MSTISEVSTIPEVRPVDLFSRLGAAVDAVAALDPADLSEDALADSLVVLRRLVDRQEAAFARLAHAGHVRGVGAGRRCRVDRGVAAAPGRDA